MVTIRKILINEALTDLTAEIAKIETSVTKKIAASMTTNLNSDIDSKLKIDINVIKQLLSSFESRLRECEMIYYTYLRDPDHAILSGSSAGLPLDYNIKFNYGSCLLEKDMNINDKTFYREIVDAQFRHFILAMASQYEVIVKLAEILVKKVIIHLPGKRPLSAPLDTYIGYLKGLVDLKYRKQDGIYHCIITHEPFLSKYLPTISRLRNSFIHGFSVNLQSDGTAYRITKFDNPFNASSPDLELNVFSKTIMEESRKFFTEMLAALDNAIKHHLVFIPA
jgi:hypothetical protein